MRARVIFDAAASVGSELSQWCIVQLIQVNRASRQEPEIRAILATQTGIGGAIRSVFAALPKVEMRQNGPTGTSSPISV
jgi:hypothetical protein